MAKKVAISTFLDPELPAFGGRQYPNGKNIFGLFAAASPDRWGRVLINKRERIIAEKEKRKPKKLHDSDYLNEMIEIVGTNWIDLAKKYGLSRAQIEEMRPAFSFCVKEMSGNR